MANLRAGLTIAIGSLSLTPSGGAVTLTVAADGGGAFPTIRAALGAAAPGDTVRVSAGVYFEHGLTLNRGVSLLGSTGNPRDVILDGELTSRVLRVLDGDSATCRGTAEA